MEILKKWKNKKMKKWKNEKMINNKIISSKKLNQAPKSI